MVLTTQHGAVASVVYGLPAPPHHNSCLDQRIRAGLPLHRPNRSAAPASAFTLGVGRRGLLESSWALSTDLLCSAKSVRWIPGRPATRDRDPKAGSAAAVDRVRPGRPCTGRAGPAKRCTDHRLHRPRTLDQPAGPATSPRQPHASADASSAATHRREESWRARRPR
jgi:hypothetical protein